MKMILTPFLLIDGDAAEAIAFYERVLGAKVLFKQTFGEMPNPPAELLSGPDRERIAHSVLKIGDSQLFVADIASDESLQPGNQVTVCITVAEAEEAEELFELLQEGGRVREPLQATYFSPAYGSVTDKFGVTFLVFTGRSKE
ncbi:glyoxalase/bleomycin resistance/extradiol dioxygenase family protein [Paenibacillus sp. M1]|uniref:Glyoxalase/bleomycin resistance/extradiol dioxygenase family protein n=1 Tax=Paenibacillus haidiansis TaxID=1574488 RepID=A0ABU7VRK3_9BACL